MTYPVGDPIPDGFTLTDTADVAVTGVVDGSALWRARA